MAAVFDATRLQNKIVLITGASGGKIHLLSGTAEGGLDISFLSVAKALAQ